jgi:uncharacterized protein YceK
VPRKPYRLFMLVLALLSGCASVPKKFAPMAKCWVSGSIVEQHWHCLDKTGFEIPERQISFDYVKTLEMFPAGDFKAFDETCHQK